MKLTSAVEFYDHMIEARNKGVGGVSETLASMVRSSQHFMLPPDGVCLGIGLQDVPKDVGLPYPLFTVEYESTDPSLSGIPFVGSMKISSRLLIAGELSQQIVEGLRISISEDCSKWKDKFFIWNGVKLKSEAGDEAWMLCPSVWIGSMSDLSLNAFADCGGLGEVHGSTSLAFVKIKTLDIANSEHASFGESSIFECRGFWELLSLLSCKNVKTRKLKPSHSGSSLRQSKGKSPLFTYHVLDLFEDYDAGEPLKSSSKSPPRAHWRRGHIRRLAKGNVWVRHCIVGSLEAGFADKSYRAREALH